MTIVLSKDVEAYIEEQVRAGVSPDANTLVNDVLRSLSEHRQPLFFAIPELEFWLLESVDNPGTLLSKADLDGIRQRVRARLDSSIL